MKRFVHLEVNMWAALGVFAVVTALAAIGGAFLARLGGYDTAFLDAYTGRQNLVYGAWPALSQGDYFAKVKNDFIAEEADFVEVDLSSMILRVYNKGAVVLEVPVKTKGKEGSWWETPSGLYKAEAKKKEHFSSFGKVYTNWNIPFQGNFFIHGWPYYPDGSPVSSSYSGGCIRLTDEDAQKVYGLVEKGMPILVFEKDFVQDDFAYHIAPPSVTAKGYLVADMKSNFVLLSSGSEQAIENSIASKLVTALVASEFQNIEKNITIPQSALVETARPRLSAGDTFTIYDLLFPLLVESSNEAAEAVAAPLGRGRALSLMEAKARSLGMTKTKFSSPSGTDDGSVTTAEDMFQLAKYLYNNRPFVLKMSAGKASTATYGEPAFTDLVETHPFVASPGFVGGLVDAPVLKETFVTSTDSLSSSTVISTEESVTVGDPRNLLSIFEFTFRGEKRPIAVIVLDSENASADARSMVDYILRTYKK